VTEPRDAPGEGEARTRGAGDPGEATVLLSAVAEGDAHASDRLLELVYAELRRLAEGALGGERVGHTLQPTALVHEAWLRLVDQESGWRNRSHFLGVASLAMRRILVDHARARQRDKRGGGAERDPLHSDLVDAGSGLDLDVLALNEGLEALEAHSQRAARVVELRFFAGLTEEEAAEVLGVTRPTVTRDWRAARAWLSNRMQRDTPE
jgi:RNA polymerase sigma factor (TIGR02999 family)